MTSDRLPLGELLFHEPPMILLDRHVADLEDGAVCEVDIRADSPFAGPDGVPAHVAVEYMAQTIGVHAGLRNRAAGRPPEIGFLLGSPKVELACDVFPIGSCLRVTAERSWDGGRVVQFRCTESDARTGDTLVTASISAYSPSREEGTR